MQICSKCNAEVKDGSNFCDQCGSKIMKQVYCTNCGKPMDKNSEFCSNCGFGIPKKSKKKEGAKKKGGKRVLIVFCLLVLFVFSGIAYVFVKPLIANNTIKNQMLFLKEGEVYYTDSTIPSPIKLTTQFTDEWTSYYQGLLDHVGDISSLFVSSANGKILFYPDKLTDEFSYTLYYRDVSNPDQKPIRVDMNVCRYSVNKSSSKVIYLNTDAELFEYDIQSASKTKIDDNVLYYACGIEDESKLIFISQDWKAYSYDGQSNLITDNTAWHFHTTEKNLILYYIENNTLIMYTLEDGKKTIADNVSALLETTEAGGVYFARNEQGNHLYLEFIEDDMEDIDADIEKATYPQEPKYVYASDYSTTEAYVKAREEYLQKYKTFQEEESLFWENFWMREERNQWRQQLSLSSIPDTKLFYYDGRSETECLEDNEYFVNRRFSIDYMDYLPGIETQYVDFGTKFVKLSELSSAEEAEEIIEKNIFSGYKYVSEDISVNISEEMYNTLRCSPDGKTLYYLENVSEDGLVGDLYQVEYTSSGELSQPRMIDNTVSMEYLSFSPDGELIYFKDPEYGYGDLYIAEKLIDYHVYCDDYVIEGSGDKKRILYYTDWNSYDIGYGELNLYKDGISEIIDPCAMQARFTDCGDVYFVAYRSYYGSLHLYHDGEVSEISDAYMLIPILSREERR